ncbi:uncharacterized protein N7484_007654 [Penicillium longicatenatum]|uniref:uncharacterized protein n=1 Tax=Penicillium longicatenatum TaxID=1561947 RepID=UPI0025471299|nr:uncharacterized protein N7484_007654 [Penicillium longicatenatum]KAJ5639792.1 hypothetical protein N7484_007654 [Penicillium longicatenatum]
MARRRPPKVKPRAKQFASQSVQAKAPRLKINPSKKANYPTRANSPLESLPAKIWCQIMDLLFTFSRNEICGPDGDIVTPLHQIGGLNFASQTTKYRVRSYISRKYGNRKFNLLRLLTRDPTSSSRLAFAVAIGCLLIDKPMKRGAFLLPTQYATELTHILTDTFTNWKTECTQVPGIGARSQSRAFKELINGAECIVAAKCRTIADYVPESWFSSTSWMEIEEMLIRKNLDWMVDMLTRCLKGPALALRFTNAKRQ